MNTDISDRQKKILAYMSDYIADYGYPPSIREIASAMSLSSSATVHAHLSKLEKAGYIKRGKGRSRSIELIKNNPHPSQNEAMAANVVLLPVIGNVAAGKPILAEENIEEYFPVTNDFISDFNDVFMLKVKGDSMINAGILDRDYIIVKKQNTAKNGEIVVALIEDEATVKRFLKTDKLIKLIPENDYMKPITLKEVDIVGRVIGVLRKYF